MNAKAGHVKILLKCRTHQPRIKNSGVRFIPATSHRQVNFRGEGGIQNCQTSRQTFFVFLILFFLIFF
jgi:hypothetical protein